MEPLYEMKKYIDTVCDQIRWKKARPFIAQELEAHICDQRDAYIADGDSVSTATHKAILQMGDAVSIGLEFDKTHKPKPQWPFILLTGVFMLIGLLANLLIYPTSFSITFHFVPIVLAFGLFLLAYYFDFTLLGKCPLFCYCLIVFSSFLSCLFGTPIDGVSRFIFGRFFISLPYLSLLFPLAFALLIYALRGKGKLGIFLCGLGIVPFAIILFIIPTFSGFILFIFSSFLLLLLSIQKRLFGLNHKEGLFSLFFTMICVITILLTLCISYAYRIEHSILSQEFQNQSISSLIYEIIRHSSFIGTGETTSYLEQLSLHTALANTDYMLLSLISRFGWITFLGILLLFATFFILGFYYVSKQKSVLGVLVSSSIMLSLLLQSSLYVLENLGYYTLSTLSLPFISSGRAGLMIDALLIGFLLSVFRTGYIFKDTMQTPTNKPKNVSPFLSYTNGKLIIQIKREP